MDNRPTTQLFAALDVQPEKTHIALENYPKLLKALEEIWRDTGHVCPNFELCTHAACRSSYAAWEIADEALASERKRITGKG